MGLVDRIAVLFDTIPYALITHVSGGRSAAHSRNAQLLSHLRQKDSARHTTLRTRRSCSLPTRSDADVTFSQAVIVISCPFAALSLGERLQM